MRSLKLVDGCKGTQVHALNPQHNHTNSGEKIHQDPHHSRAKSVLFHHTSTTSTTTNLTESILPYGLPVADLIEPRIEPHLRPVDLIETLATIHLLLKNSTTAAKPNIYLYQYSVFRGLSDPKLLRRSLRSARQHAGTVHDKVVTAAWLRFERREDEFDGASSMGCCGRTLECPVSSLLSGYDPDSVFDPCPCRQPPASERGAVQSEEECSTSAAPDEEEGDIGFFIGDDEVICVRSKIAALSRPLRRMLYGGFQESRRDKIDFSQNGISVHGMRAVDEFSKAGSLEPFPPEIVVELLSFANRFCCEDMKSSCDKHLASFVNCMEDALILIEYGLEENAYLLVAACLQVFLGDLPRSLNCPDMTKVLCSTEGRNRLAAVGHSSFLLYYFLCQVAMEEDMQSNTLVMLLERLGECAAEVWQKQLALHQLGCVMLERKEYKDAQHWFEAAAEAEHVYSLAGVARAKYRRGHKYLAYKQMNTLISECKPVGWMYQERSLYCVGKEKMMDLNTATEMDPTLSYPYKYRAIAMMDDNKIGAAISEINKILGFKVSPDCLELRAWFNLAQEDYESALRDIRAMMTLDPNHMMFHGKMPGNQLVEILSLSQHIQQWSLADCWMHLYDRWSSVDDIGSLAVVHQMLENEPRKSLLRFRQSLLLLR